MALPEKLQKAICIIDDDPYILEIYRKKFEQEHFKVITAPDGESGLALIRAQKPDIILLDIQMPVKNGIEVLRDLSSDSSVSSIPVIILSNVEDEATFKTIGKIDKTRFYLIKSLTTPQKAVDIVREVLP